MSRKLVIMGGNHSLAVSLASVIFNNPKLKEQDISIVEVNDSSLTKEQIVAQHPDAMIIVPQESKPVEKHLEDFFIDGIRSTYFLKANNDLDYVDIQFDKNKPKYRFDGKPKSRR